MLCFNVYTDALNAVNGTIITFGQVRYVTHLVSV